MSAAEVEIVEQFSGFDDRDRFELPKLNEDIKTPRYLFTAANLIDPKVARERPHMKSGGLNVFNPCLNLSRDFIRRGRIVPLLVNQHIPIPAEEANLENNLYFSIPLDGDSLRQMPGSFPDQGGMMGYPAFPGQQIAHIIEGTPNIDGSGQRVGIVEITTLKGHDYKLENLGGFHTDPELWKIQRAIFPDYPSVPFALRPFTQLIQDAIDRSTGVIRDIAEEMLPSCKMFESWAVRHVERTHQNMAQAAVKGYSSPYEDIDLVVLEQLEMHREDEHYKRLAQQRQQAPPVDATSLLNAVRAGSKEDREAFQTMLLEVIKELKSPVVDENTMKAEPKEHWKTREKREREQASESSE